MSEAKKEKAFKSTDVVLTYERKGKKFEVQANSLHLHDLKDAKVSGEAYYVDKAVRQYGAKKSEESKDAGKKAAAPTAAEIVELIKAAESVETIAEYAEDTRKTVQDAYKQKLEELSE